MNQLFFIRKHFSKIFVISSVLIAVVLGIIFAYTQLERNKVLVNQKSFRIATSIFPVTLFVTNLVGNKVIIDTIIPPGIDIHSYELTPGDVYTLLDADLVVILGNKLEPLEEKLIDLIQNENQGQDRKPQIIALSDGIDLLPIDMDEEHEEEETHLEDEHGQYDPHIWLSPRKAKMMVKNLEQALIAFDSNDTDLYRVRSTELSSRLEQLHDVFSETLSSTACKKDTILVNHNAYGYLGAEYGFKIISLKGLSLESEPTPQELAHINDIAESKSITHLFYEETSDPRTAKTLAAELGASLLPLYPIEIKPTDGVLMNIWGRVDERNYYFEFMELNLQNLAIGLECVRAQ